MERTDAPVNVVVFDVWSDLACFRRFYTNRSPLSFPVPTRTALAGLVGGIMGVEKTRLADTFSPDNARLAVAVVNPIKTTRMCLNWIDTKRSPEVLRRGVIVCRTQINVEFLKNPRYRVFAAFANQSQSNELRDLLAHHKSVYTPYLGMSELIAEFAYVGEYQAARLGDDSSLHPIRTVLPVAQVVWPDEGEGVQFEAGKHYSRQRMPRLMDGTRTVIEWQDVIVETSGTPILAQVTDCWKVGDDHIVWL